MTISDCICGPTPRRFAHTIDIEWGCDEHTDPVSLPDALARLEAAIRLAVDETLDVRRAA